MAKATGSSSDRGGRRRARASAATTAAAARASSGGPLSARRPGTGRPTKSSRGMTARPAAQPPAASPARQAMTAPPQPSATKRSVSFAMFVAGLLALPRPGGADEVYLRGGGRLSGVVVDRNASSVVVDVGPGQVTVAASQVERIVAGTPALALFRERSFRLS